jgi:4'-phosphopantetheinyl transferase
MTVQIALLPIDEHADRVYCEAWANTLNEAERAQADRFRRSEDRTRYIAAHALTRVMLGVAIGEAPRGLRLSVGSHGKPFLQDRDGVHFNLTHTDGLVACALHDAPVGCDAEPSDRVVGTDVFDLLAVHERRWLLGVSSGQQRNQAFIRLWVVKEAFVKCLGLGLLLDPSTYAFDLADGAARLVEAPATIGCGPWTVPLLDVGPGHVFAIATEGDGMKLPKQEWIAPRDLALACVAHRA